MTSALTVHGLLSDFLDAHGLVADRDTVGFEPLSGGVSSDIWLVTDGSRRVVVKQPLLELKVVDEWQAPLTRSSSEANWLEEVSGLVPGACPRVLAFDATASLLALEYLDPETHYLWKADLLAGRVDVRVAMAVGDRLGRIHELTSQRPELAERFATDDLFSALRIEPYLDRLVQHHPQLAEPVAGLVRTTMGTRRALVHGDVSPKNILVGPGGPVLLDAETAWWGDPAFDLAFCLNHLLLKSLLPAPDVDQLVDSVDAVVAAYAAHVSWEDPESLMARVTALLPALLLARVDGRSPVEYLGETERALVRSFALDRVINPPTLLVELTGSWKESVR